METSYLTEISTTIGGMAAGILGGIWAEKKNKKSEAMQELLEVKAQYRELSEYTNAQFDRIKVQLEDSRKSEEECMKRHREALEMVNKQEERILVLAEVIARNMEEKGLPDPIKRPHRKDLLK